MSPARPSSSPAVASTKSDLAAKPIRVECPSPRPVPSTPPAANANSDCASWLGPRPASIDASGCSQSAILPCTCGSSRPTATAPSTASSSPAAIQPTRPVATYRSTTNSPKNSSEVPRSRSSASTPTLSSHTAATGPSTRPVGTRVHHSLRPACASASRLAAR